MIQWQDITEEDGSKIHHLAVRATKLARADRQDYPLHKAHMDLCACHLTLPLDLDALAQATDEDFSHDICGISQHLDRTTGQLQDGFAPRYAQHPDRPPFDSSLLDLQPDAINDTAANLSAFYPAAYPTTNRERVEIGHLRRTHGDAHWTFRPFGLDVLTTGDTPAAAILAGWSHVSTPYTDPYQRQSTDAAPLGTPS